jgi:hypothetical protein
MKSFEIPHFIVLSFQFWLQVAGFFSNLSGLPDAAGL